MARKPAKRSKHVKRSGAKQKKPDATAIVRHVVQPEVDRGNLELFRTPNRKAFATLRIQNHFENYGLRSDDFKMWLARAIYVSQGVMPSDTTVNKVIRTLEGEALFGKHSVERPVFHRIAKANNIYLDLCDTEWRVVEVAPTGWWLAKNPPVRFVRSPVSRPLPQPELGGNLNEIFNFVHITRREHQVLFLGWLIGALQTHAPCPILALHGSQGAAKTTACRIAAGLIDPAEPQLVTAHTTERDLLIDAMHSHVIGLDNISEIDDRLSDSLCRLATGSGMRRRQLYTDNGLFAVAVKKPVVLNAIAQTASRGDLLDRMIALRLDAIPENERREEGRLIAEFEKLRPRLLGALLTAVSAALRNLPSVVVKNLPRMADFATWVTAAQHELGFVDGEFLDAYRKNRQESSDTTLEFSAIGLPIIALVDAGSFCQGSIKDLLTALNASANDQLGRDPNWPRSERALSSTLARIDANLDAAGYVVTRLRKDPKTRRGVVRIEKKTKPVVVEFHAAAVEAVAT